MEIAMKSTLISLGLLPAAFAFSGCASTGNSIDGTHTMSAPKNTTYTMPDENMPGGR